MENYLLVGLGNPGIEYAFTRHNIGFLVIDELAGRYNGLFKSDRHGLVTLIKIKGRQVFLLKPNTYMNLSGKAVRYWLQEQKIKIENCCIIADDLALPFGQIRLKPSGSDGGHNGLKSITEYLQTQQFPRLRWGIGNNFPKGKQADFVLQKWLQEEEVNLFEHIALAADCLEMMVSSGIQVAMNKFNSRIN